MLKITYLKQRYETVLGQFKKINPFLNYITVEESPYLWGFVVLANELEAIERIEDLILGSLTNEWTFSPKGTCMSEFPTEFVNQECDRWALIIKYPVTLSELLQNRLGNCESYAITTAIVLAVTGKARAVKLYYGQEKHMWVETETPNHLIDLFNRSHGKVPTQHNGYYLLLEPTVE